MDDPEGIAATNGQEKVPLYSRVLRSLRDRISFFFTGGIALGALKPRLLRL